MEHTIQIILTFVALSIVVPSIGMPFITSYILEVWNAFHQELEKAYREPRRTISDQLVRMAQDIKRWIVIFHRVTLIAMGIIFSAGLISFILVVLALRTYSLQGNISLTQILHGLCIILTIQGIALGVLAGVFILCYPTRRINRLREERLRARDNQPHPMLMEEVIISKRKNTWWISKAYIYLFNPIFWVGGVLPLVIGILVGINISSISSTQILKIIFALTSYLGISVGGQAINDFYDFEIDRINKPHRPLPSGRTTKKGFFIFTLISYVFSILLAAFLGLSFFLLTLLFAFLYYFYSAPPLRFKRHALMASPTIFLFYGLLPTLAGYLLFHATLPIIVWVLAFGIAVRRFGSLISKDYEDIKGDLKHNCKTFPVLLGVRGATILEGSLIVIAQAIFFSITVTVTLSLAYIFFIIALGILLTSIEFWFLRRPLEAEKYYVRYVIPTYTLQMILISFGLQSLQ